MHKIGHCKRLLKTNKVEGTFLNQPFYILTMTWLDQCDACIICKRHNTRQSHITSWSRCIAVINIKQTTRTQTLNSRFDHIENMIAQIYRQMIWFVKWRLYGIPNTAISMYENRGLSSKEIVALMSTNNFHSSISLLLCLDACLRCRGRYGFLHIVSCQYIADESDLNWQVCFHRWVW